MPLVIFDLDNTLIDRDGAFGRWADEFADRHGLDPGERRWLAREDHGGFSPRPAFLSRVRERYRLDEPVETLLERYWERMLTATAAYPETHATLDRLRGAGWRVAIATNGIVAHQWTKIRRADLTAAVDAVAVSGEVGVEKPDRRMFEAAAARAGARLADGGWMVGDCPTRDIGGGRAAGLRTIWMRHGRSWDSGPPPDATVDGIGETARVLVTSAVDATGFGAAPAG